MNITAIIPARGGSKGVPKKNVYLLDGYPLIAYSIAAAVMSKKIGRIIVSTDSEEIAEISKGYGAEVPFLRPAELAKDSSTDLELFVHVINWLKENKEKEQDLLVHIRPTTPLREPGLLDASIDAIIASSKGTALRSAHELPEPPQKMFQISSKGFFEGFFPLDPRPEYYNLPRQNFAKAYHPNGYVDIIKPRTIADTGSLHGSNIVAFITPFSVEVDAFKDFELLEFQLSRNINPVHEYLKNNFKREG